MFFKFNDKEIRLDYESFEPLIIQHLEQGKTNLDHRIVIYSDYERRFLIGEAQIKLFDNEIELGEYFDCGSLLRDRERDIENAQSTIEEFIKEFNKKWIENREEIAQKSEFMRERFIFSQQFKQRSQAINRWGTATSRDLEDFYANLKKSSKEQRRDFHSAGLENLILTKEKQVSYDFTRANLSHANFEGTSFVSTQFNKADLRYANLKDTQLKNVDLTGADLESADLSGAILGSNKTIYDAIISKETKLDETFWNTFGADMLLKKLKDLGEQYKDVKANGSVSAEVWTNPESMKIEAKELVDLILPNITSNKELLKLVAIIEGKDGDFAFLRKERHWWRFHEYGDTATWSTILGKIKTQLDENVERCKDEEYTKEEYEVFLKIMNEHRGRGFGSVTHSKMYEQIEEDNPSSTYRISKK